MVTKNNLKELVSRKNKRSMRRSPKSVSKKSKRSSRKSRKSKRTASRKSKRAAESRKSRRSKRSKRAASRKSKRSKRSAASRKSKRSKRSAASRKSKRASRRKIAKELTSVINYVSKINKPNADLIKAYNFFRLSDVDPVKLFSNYHFPEELKTENDKIIFLWEEMKVKPTLVNAFKHFLKYNLNIDNMMEKYAKNDPEYIKLLSDMQRLVYIYNKESNKMKATLAEAEKFLGKKDFNKLKNTYKDELKKYFDMKTLSKNEQENLAKIHVAEQEKNKEIESKFLGNTNAWF